MSESLKTVTLDADLDPRLYSTEEHVDLALHILEKSGATAFLGVNDKAKNLCQTVAAMYLSTPYHNFKHAFNVMHTTYMLIQSLKESPFSTLETTGLLLAALCHDIQHNGRTSGFHKSVNSPLAQEFSDHKASVLEAMHASVALQTMMNERIFDNLDETNSNTLKTLIEELILATDMAIHDEVIQEYGNKSDTLTQAKMILHCADISNPTKRPDIAKWWSHAVSREFRFQVDEEAKLGIPVSTYMKVDLFSAEEAKMHLGFIDSFVAPSWRLLSTSNRFDDYVTVHCMSNIARSRRMWLNLTESQSHPEDLIKNPDLKRMRFEDIPCVNGSRKNKRRYFKVNRISQLDNPADCHVI
ncbi:hypothetical protein AC1031_001168 [Aphanomyces cochlioides]|nr:hypothetical protein AC1031_001168 [Aphanomyces cochlioides]